MSAVVKLGNALTKVAGENDAIQNVKIWLDTGFPPLNKAISGRYNGGFPVGRIVEMFGPESSGKTMIATKAMIQAQQMGGIAIFNDHERSFDSKIANQVGLLTGEGDPWIFKTPETFEQSVTETIKMVEDIRDAKLISPDAPIVVVFDSLASMVPKSKMAKAVDEQGMNDSLALAKATSAVFPVLTQYVQKYNMLCIVLNQTRLKPGVIYGNPTTTPGGEAPKFYASVRVQLSKSLSPKDKASGEVTYQDITASCIKNKVSAPFRKAKWRFMFNADGSGHFDVVGSLLEYMVENDLIEQAGTRIVWEGKSYYRAQLTTKIETEGTIDKLMALLPTDID